MTPALGIWLDSYRLSLKEALQTAAAQGFSAIHANTVGGDLSPEQFGESARRHLRKYLRDLGLRLDALAVVYPGAGLSDPRHVEGRLTHVRQTLELCRDLGVASATIQAPGVGAAPESTLARELLTHMADLADRVGVRVGVLDAVSTPEQVETVIRALGGAPLGLTLDSAQLESAAALARRAPDLISAVHFRDIRRNAGGSLEETRIGTGEVDFRELLAALAAGEFRGPCAVRRDGHGAVDELRAGREYIESLMT